MILNSDGRLYDTSKLTKDKKRIFFAKLGDKLFCSPQVKGLDTNQVKSIIEKGVLTLSSAKATRYIPKGMSSSLEALLMTISFQNFPARITCMKYTSKNEIKWREFKNLFKDLLMLNEPSDKSIRIEPEVTNKKITIPCPTELATELGIYTKAVESKDIKSLAKSCSTLSIWKSKLKRCIDPEKKIFDLVVFWNKGCKPIYKKR